MAAHPRRERKGIHAMSTLVVEVCEVKAVYPHPNADALEFITVKG